MFCSMANVILTLDRTLDDKPYLQKQCTENRPYQRSQEAEPGEGIQHSDTNGGATGRQGLVTSRLRSTMEEAQAAATTPLASQGGRGGHTPCMGQKEASKSQGGYCSVSAYTFPGALSLTAIVEFGDDSKRYRA